MLENIKDKRKRVQIISTEPQKQFLDEAAAQQGVSVSALIRGIVDTYKNGLLEQALAESARSLYVSYENDKELTAFTSLDGEDFV